MKKFLVAAGLFLALLGGKEAFAQVPAQHVQVQVTFQDNAENEDGFYIYRCQGAGCIPTERVATLPANPSVGQVTATEGIPADTGGQVYGYAVSAFNAIGESAKTETVYVTTPVILLLPNGPSGINAIVVGVTLQ